MSARPISVSSPRADRSMSEVTDSDPTESLSPKCFDASVGFDSRPSKSWLLLRTRMTSSRIAGCNVDTKRLHTRPRISTIAAISEMLASWGGAATPGQLSAVSDDLALNQLASNVVIRMRNRSSSGTDFAATGPCAVSALARPARLVSAPAHGGSWPNCRSRRPAPWSPSCRRRPRAPGSPWHQGCVGSSSARWAGCERRAVRSALVRSWRCVGLCWRRRWLCQLP